jgi:acetyl esterase/lipase
MNSVALPNEVIPLWSEGAPTKLEGVGPETEFRGLAGVSVDTLMRRNVSEPTLTVFRPINVKPNGIGVIVCPGGGWRILAWQHEGIDVALWLAERGYTAFLLKYRVSGTPVAAAEFEAAMAAMSERIALPRSGRDAPRVMSDIVPAESIRKPREAAADDGRRAVAIIRERAADWGVEPDKIGMIGFSAGAFLAADVAMEPRGAPLAFVAPIYGGETMGRPVPADAPPLFTVIAQDDRLLFRVVEGLYADWSSADRPAELHIFTRGAHGFGMIRQGLPSDRWIDLFRDWLVDQGFA